MAMVAGIDMHGALAMVQYVVGVVDRCVLQKTRFVALVFNNIRLLCGKV